MPTGEDQPVPFQSRRLLNQEVRKSQGWEEPEDSLQVMGLLGKEGFGPECN